MKAARRRQSGLTLTELLLSIGIIMSILWVGMVAYSQSSYASQAYNAKATILSLRGVVGSMRKNGYEGISPAAIITTGKAPAVMINGAGLISSWGKAVNIAPATVQGVPNAGYSMAFEGMPKQICPEILGNLVEQFDAVIIAGDTIKDLTADPKVDDRGIPAIISACQADDAVDVVLISL